MRIGVDARLVFYSQAGIGQYILRLTEALAQVDHEDEFYLLQSRKDKTRMADAPNFYRRDLWTPSHHRFEQIALAMEVAAFRLDLLHSPDFIPPFYRHWASVITVHDLAFLLFPHFMTKEAARYYSQIDQAVKRTDHIIAVSESTKRDTVKLLGVPAEKITVIYEAANPVYRPLDDPPALALSRRKYRLAGDFILCVGTIEPRKNLPHLLRAFRRLLDEYRLDVHLVLAGEAGWLYQEVFAAVEELHLGDRVRFLGKVSVDDLLLLYNAARLFVTPSKYEGFGLPLLEAMACGTPVIATNVSSLPEVVGDAGLLVSPEDEAELTVAMWRVLTDEALRAEMREKGLKRAKLFSWERAAQETLAVYRRVVNER